MMKKTIISIIIILSVLLGTLCAFPIASYAAISGTCGANLTWSLSGDTLTISGSGEMKDYSWDYDVPWYSSRTMIKKIVIGDKITSIGDHAFQYCNSLTSINIPGDVTNIGNYAFSYCTGLMNVVIQSGVTNIGDYAFSHCACLINVVIPGSVTNIGNYAFGNCGGLIDVVISSGVKYIRQGAFSGCKNLISITIPSSVISIEYAAFLDSNIRSVITFGSEKWKHQFDHSVRYVVLPQYQVTFKGEYSETQAVDSGANARLPVPPEGYTYSYKANGANWTDTPITKDITITVIKTPNKYIVTFIGDYSGKQTVDYGSKVILPTPPAGYIYSYKVDGKKRGNAPTITGDMTIEVEKTIAEYICGDANNDGEVTELDSIFLARYLAKRIGYDETTVDLITVDTNTDGKVTAMDYVVLSRHLAKWQGYDLLPCMK